jgi:hypothetical protein
MRTLLDGLAPQLVERHGELHGLLDLYVRACVRALCTCVYCTQTSVLMFLDGFSPNLEKTFLGSQKLAWHT